MEMVAASKMRKSQEAALMARPYAEAALHILDSVSKSAEPRKHILLEKREVKNICLLVIASDKGLCGGLNSNVFKEASKIINENENKDISIITVGKKAENHFKKRENISAAFDGIGDTVELKETLPISKLLIDDFENRKYDKIVAIYTNFVSTLRQDVKVRKILPITRRSVEEIIEEIEEMADKDIGDKKSNNVEYKFEPSPEEVLRKLLPNLIEIQVFHMILESNASEHSARMIAMKNATDNANEMLQDLNLSYNYARQQRITQEMSEISAGVVALES
jgi:F-type H+-transporting ATPase subunit gamma